MDSDSENFSDEFPEEGDFSDTEEVEEKSEQNKAVKGARHLEDLKSTLGLVEFQDKTALKRAKRKRQKERRKLKKLNSSVVPQNGQIQTKATKLSKKAAAKTFPEVFTYNDPKKREKKPEKVEVRKRKIDEESDEVTMKQARFDVFKFGLRGFDKEGQNEARVALALRLGAKPEKKACIPYAELKEKRKIEKEEQLKKIELEKMTGMRKVSTRAPSTKKSKKKEEAASAQKNKKKKTHHEATPLKLGKFDGGTLKLSKKDLSSVKSKKR